MKLSVILPYFNGSLTIAVQLDVVTRQAWPSGWELIVVNNGSTDFSMEIVEAFVFCEADDEVAPGWLAAMGQSLALHDFVVARLDHRKLNAEWLHPVQGDGYQSAGLYKMPVPPYFFSASACGFGIKRSLYKALGRLSTDFPIVHDGEYCWRAMQFILRLTRWCITGKNQALWPGFARGAAGAGTPPACITPGAAKGSICLAPAANCPGPVAAVGCRRSGALGVAATQGANLDCRLGLECGLGRRQVEAVD